MVNVILVDDDFATLVLDQQLHGRAPPVRSNSTTYNVEPTTGIAGGGSSTIKILSSGAAFKLSASSENVAVQLIYNDNSSNENASLFLRDNQSTPYPRNGFWVRFASRAPTPYFGIAITDNYNSTWLYQNIPWNFSANGTNKVAFECNNTAYRVIINDALAYSFTHTSWPPDGTRTRCGAFFSYTTTSLIRGTRFTFYDSIDVAAPVTQYPVVRFG